MVTEPKAMSGDWANLRDALAASGLNVFGIAGPEKYDAVTEPERRTSRLLEGTRSVVVVASGGRALWDAFVDGLRRDPSVLVDEPHPLDAFVRKRIDEGDALLPASIDRRWFFAAASAEPQLDFRVLGRLAGIGERSRLGLLIHPTYGLWLGLRAACFTTAELEPSATPPNPCAACDAPCRPACPAGALDSGSWDVDRCAAFHLADHRCATTCHSRLACPVGAEQRYPPEEIEYHYNRPLGRRSLRVFARGFEDRYEGEGPHWGNWRSRPNVAGRASR